MCVGPTVDESRPCLAAFHTKNEQAHLWILIYVCMHIPQTSAAISGLLVAVWVPARQILHRNIVWGPRAGIIVLFGLFGTVTRIGLLRIGFIGFFGTVTRI